MKKTWEFSVVREMAALATHGQDESPRLTIVIMPPPLPDVHVAVAAPQITMEAQQTPPRQPRQIRVKERDANGRIVSAEITGD